MRKAFVLDTNILLEDPRALYRFEEHKVVIPYEVLVELDNNKKRQDISGHNAREAIRELDSLRELGSLFEGVPLPTGGTLSIGSPVPDQRNMDESIIQVTVTLSSKNPELETHLITNDIAMRVMAEMHGVSASAYTWSGKREIQKLYSGAQRIALSREDVNTLYDEGGISLPDYVEEEIFPHQFVIAKAPGDSSSAICRFKEGRLHKVTVQKEDSVGGVRPKNKEQQFALDLLLDPDVPLVTLIGSAGCGKSLMATAAGIEQVLEEQTYEKILVSRPIQPMGRDMGFLPGTVEEKLAPWIQPIKDSLQLLLGKDKRTMELKFSDGTIEVEALSYIRGRSIPNAYMIVDEAQNLSVPEMKAIVTRMGQGSKLVITGDIEQIDTSHFDSRTNGLAYLIEKMKDQAVSGHITLLKGERSELASLAAKIL